MKGDITKPMMTPAEVKVLDEMLDAKMPEQCLELGSGGSTLYFPKKHKFIKYWRSIEHNGHYAKALRKKIQDNTDIIWERSNNRGKYYDEAGMYTYDFVLIDGLERAYAVGCLFQLLNNNGWAILHDACWDKHKGVIKEYNGEMIIEGDGKSGGFALFKQHLL